MLENKVLYSLEKKTLKEALVNIVHQNRNKQLKNCYNICPIFNTRAIRAKKPARTIVALLIPPIYMTFYICQEFSGIKGYDYTRAGTKFSRNLERFCLRVEIGKYATYLPQVLVCYACYAFLKPSDRI